MFLFSEIYLVSWKYVASLQGHDPENRWSQNIGMTICKNDCIDKTNRLEMFIFSENQKMSAAPSSAQLFFFFLMYLFIIFIIIIFLPKTVKYT